MAIDFSRTDVQFEEVKKAAEEAVHTIFPVEGKLRKMILKGVTIKDNLNTTNYVEQKSAKIGEKTWGVPVYAHLVLMEKGQIIDEDAQVKLFTLPKPTQRHSYIVGGNEYQVQNQLRLRPGVYTIRQQNGELKTQFNLAKGANFDVVFNENTGLISITGVAGGDTKINLYPILRDLGMTRKQVADVIGEKLTAVNEQRSDPKAVEKLRAALKVPPSKTIGGYFQTTALDNETTKITLGKSFDKVESQLLLLAAKQLIDVHLGKKPPTDRDSLEFKELHSIDDFIRERLEKNKTTLIGRVRRGIDNPKKVTIKQLISPDTFNPIIQDFFLKDDKTFTPEQTNPLEMLTSTQSMTFMGAGGIGDTHSIKDEMRQIHPSHFGMVDVVHTPESDRTGINLHAPIGAAKLGKKIVTTVVDKSGKEAQLEPNEFKNYYVALPDQKGAMVKAMYHGQVVEIPRAKADYFIPSATNLFSWSTNLIPFLPSAQGNRASMAAKMMEQAISLTHREAPLVQSAAPDGRTMEEKVGDQASIKSPADGIVTDITDDQISIKTPSGVMKVNLYNNFSLNRKSFLHNTPSVKKGDVVKKGQLLADSNFTKGGVLALGTNLRTAYIPYKGYNHDDGIVISEQAAKKLTSEHIYKKELDLSSNTITNLTVFRKFYPNAISPKNFAKLDEDGVIKKDSVVEYGDVLIAAVQKRDVSQEIRTISGSLSEKPKNISLDWTLEDRGSVLDVRKAGNKVVITIKTFEIAKVGDKLAGRHGNKGVITRIVADHEMPHDKAGNPMDMLLNPVGVISRINVSQLYESAAAKVADKIGTPYKVKNFGEQDYQKVVADLMKKEGITDKEELIDPTSGKSLGKIHVGLPHTLKLFKQSQVNYSVRQGGPGHQYDANLQPLKAGGEEGAKAIDQLTIYSLLSHGARENLREMSTIKSSKNDEFWKAFKSGELLPPPDTTFAYNKFLGYLKGAGIDVKKEGSSMMLAPYTDKEIKKNSSGAVTKPDMYRPNTFSPIKGGFFDPLKFGGNGFDGKNWGHMELTESVVNPPFENAVKKLTGLGKKYDQIVSGKLFLNDKGELNSDGKGVTGGAAIEQMLKSIDVDAEIASLTKKALSSKGDTLDKINKKLRYLTSLKKLGLRPEEAYIRKTLPVLPPHFRPIYPLPDGNVTSSDINYIYQNTGILNHLMKLPVMGLLAEQDKSNIRKDLNDHVKGVSGLLDINIKGKEREGFISQIKGGAGGQPKEGFFISKLISKKQDYVGRGTIIPEPSLGVDEVGIPEQMAWKLFEPFIVRELKKRGLTPLNAIEAIKRKTSDAKIALKKVMEERHVLLNRAPSLHKYSIMAFKPTITDGKAIKIPPLINAGFNADFDGDTMTIHAPVMEGANREAAKMLPSKNLFKPGSGSLMIVPTQEAQIGLYYLSKTPEGRKRLNTILGGKWEVKETLNKSSSKKLLTQVAKEATSTEFGRIVNELKREGEGHAYERGFTLGVDDLVSFSKERDAIIRKAGKMLQKEDPHVVNEAITGVVDKFLATKLKDKDHPLFDMIESGAKGSSSQLRSIMFSPLFVSDNKDKVVATPIKKSYAEGLGVADYWTAMYGARKGMMGRAVQTSLPGAFSKDVMASVLDVVISANDCGTKDGVDLPISSPDLLDRYLAGDQGGFAHNTFVDTNCVNGLKRKGLLTVKVRSPLKCRQAKGVCAHCYGHDEHGKIPDIGENIGAKAGQTISEPLVQLAMNVFHTGGVAGTGTQATGFARIQQLLNIPENILKAAALSPIDGKVTKLVKGVGGGYEVTVGNQVAHIAHGQKPLVAVGQLVTRGQQLSTGPIKPQELTTLRGVEATQDYLTNELQGTYKDQKVGIHRKTFETVVRNLTNSTRVTNNPKDSSFLPGDVVPYSEVRAYNENRLTEIDVDQAIGLEVAQDYGSVKAGKKLTDKDVALIKALGHKRIRILKDLIEHQPFIKGTTALPLLKKDWMAALGYRNLSKVLTEGSAQGWVTDLEGYHPIPALAHGATFGIDKDKKGTY